MAAAGGYINPMAIAAQLPAQVQMPNGLTSPAAMTPTSGSYRCDRHPPTCLPDMPLYAFLFRLFRLFCSIPSYFVLFRLLSLACPIVCFVRLVRRMFPTFVFPLVIPFMCTCDE